MYTFKFQNKSPPVKSEGIGFIKIFFWSSIGSLENGIKWLTKVLLFLHTINLLTFFAKVLIGNVMCKKIKIKPNKNKLIFNNPGILLKV